MAINSIRDNRNTFTKGFTVMADFATYAVSHLDNRVYFPGPSRFMTELGRLDYYGMKGLPVPKVSSVDYSRLRIEMEKLPGKNLLAAIFDNELSRRGILQHLEKYAEALRDMHECGGEHGDPILRNLMAYPGGRRVIDFEHTRQNGKEGDLSALFMDALARAPAEPEELWTPLVRAAPFLLHMERFAHSKGIRL